MRISLLIPCFVDQFYPNVGRAVVGVLRRLGHAVDYPAGQTCCGQPPFNAGHHAEARRVAGHTMSVMSGCDLVAVPSGSCAAMVRKFYPELFAGTDREAEANELAKKTHEFSELLADVLGVGDVGAAFAGRATFHDGCHGLRELGVKSAPRRLLSHVRGLELVEHQEAETCCGFGGTFAVKFPQISGAMAQTKCRSVAEVGADTVISNDPSCLMQIQGYADRNAEREGARPIRCLHLAEVLDSREEAT